MEILKSVRRMLKWAVVSVKAWHHRRHVLPRIEAERVRQIRGDLSRNGYETLKDYKRLRLLTQLTLRTYSEFAKVWRGNICGIQNHYGSMMTWNPTSKTLFEYNGKCVDGDGRQIDGWEGRAELGIGEKFPFSVYSSTYDHNKHETVSHECYGFDNFESAMRYFLRKSVPKNA